MAASTLQFTAPNLKTPYSEQATLTVERQFRNDMVLSVSGVWSRGVSLYGVTDVNAPLPSTLKAYTIDDASGNQVDSHTTPV